MDQKRASELNLLLGLVSPKKLLMQLHFFQWHLVILFHFVSALCQLERHHTDTQMIHYKSASMVQEGLGKTDLPVPFWTVSWQEIYVPKMKEKKSVCFSVSFTFAQLNFQWNRSLKTPFFPSFYANIMSSTFRLIFLLFFLYVFFNILKQVGLDLTWGCGCSWCLWFPTHPFLSFPQKSKLESIKWKTAQHRPWSVSIWV